MLHKRLPRVLALTLLIALSAVGLVAYSHLGTAHADNTDPAHYDNIPNYQISGVGNTYVINNPAYTHVQSYIDEAVVDSSGCVHTRSKWDEGGNNWGVYCNGTVQMHNSSNAPSNVDNTSVTINGRTWTINSGAVKDSNGVQVPGITKATALGVDLPDNQLMVGDDGVGQHVVKFFDVSGNPNLTRTFGTVGGIAAGNPGEVTPTKFWGITGVGTDSSGNIYVAGSQNAAYIRSFTPDGNTLRWQMYGLHFEDSCDFDHADDAQTIYCNQKVYHMDYSKPAGQQWTLKYFTLNTDAYPDDKRGGDGENSAGYTPFSTWYRVLDGHRFLITIDQDNFLGFTFFKFKDSDGGWIASPSINKSADSFGGYEGDFKVAANGDLYKAGCDSIRYSQFQGIDGNGDPIYGPIQQISVPAPFNCVEELAYNQATDTMILGGGTPSQPTMGWGNAGPVAALYTNWSDANNRHLNWTINIPFYHNDDPNVDARHVPIDFSTAGNYLFISYVDKDSDFQAQDGESGVTRVYRTGDGSYVGRMLPDGTYGGVQGSWIDESSGAVKAYERADGTYLIIREENWLDKNILYIWNPDGPPPGYTPTPTPTPAPGPGGALDRSAWKLSASNNSSSAGDAIGNAIDGNLNTRWSSGTGQSNGQWFQIDLGSTQSFNKVVLDATNSPNDFPASYQLFVSNDGSNWGSAVASGNGSTVTTITFSAQTARYVKIVQTGSSAYWWSIDEVNVYPPPASTPTPTPTPTPISGGTLVTAINAGGSASGSFVADADYDQGNQYSDTSSSITTSGVTNAAPQAVYQTCRWNSSFTYTIPGLTAGKSYKVRLHWAELTFGSAGQRVFNVAINGNAVLSNFDVYATAGYKKALIKEFTVTANSSGQIVIAFTQGGADNPFINGIEVYTA